MTESYTTTAEYDHISVALKSYWKPFNELLKEMNEFEPQPLSAFGEKRKRLFEQIQKMNPHMSNEEVNGYVEKDVAASETPGMQFWKRFSDRLMTMQVTITLLSQALCEAEINAILAVGLYEKGLADQFAKIEKSDIRTKWLEHPNKFCPSYELKRDAELYVTLDHLIEQRNSWMHHKSHLHVGEEKIIGGSKLQNYSYEDSVRWMKRYFSLPYDLAEHAHAYTHQAIAAIMLYQRHPISVAEEHTNR